jgi:hypothetical protein
VIAITLNQLRRYTLEQQGLLERKPSNDLFQFGPLHYTDHTTPYLSLLGRLQGFQWEALMGAIQRSEFTLLRSMRGTLHLIDPAHTAAIQCLYMQREGEKVLEFNNYNIQMEDAIALREEILRLMTLHGPQSPVTIKKIIDPKWVVKHTYMSTQNEITNLAPVMRWMWQLGLLEMGAKVHQWRTKDNTYSLVENPPQPCLDSRPALAEVARWYFDLYGPAAYEDWAWWTGLKMEPNKTAFAAVQANLVEVQAQGIAETLWIPADQAEALAQTPDEAPPMARLLPYEDALIKAYKATRWRFYDDEGLAEDIAITGGGEAVPTLWLNGQIVGIWEWSKKANEPMTIQPFIQMTKSIRKQLMPEVEQVQRFIQASHVLWTT